MRCAVPAAPPEVPQGGARGQDESPLHPDDAIQRKLPLDRAGARPACSSHSSSLTLTLPVFPAPPDQAASPDAAVAPTAKVNGDCLDPPLWVTLDGWKVLEIRAVPGAQNPEGYRQRTVQWIHQLARNAVIQPDQLVLRDQPPYTFIGIERNGRFTREVAVEDRAAACFDLTRQELATRYRDSIRTAIARYRKRNTPRAWLEGSAQALLVLGIFILWLRGQLAVNDRLRARIARRESFPLLGRLRLLEQVLDTAQARSVLQYLRMGLHWLVLLLIGYLLIPLLLGFFPPTEGIAEGLRSQILELLAGALAGVAAAIPNLLSILVILAITVLVIRASNAWFKAVDRGQMRIPGFYQEWALPTARLATILIALTGLVLAYPYIPGSNSRAFQGAGLLLGVLAALGSSAVATNIISGLMLIYTRAFRDGDRVDINGTVGCGAGAGPAGDPGADPAQRTGQHPQRHRDRLLDRELQLLPSGDPAAGGHRPHDHHRLRRALAEGARADAGRRRQRARGER